MRHTSKGADEDVRMRGFAQRHTVDAALAWLDAQIANCSRWSAEIRAADGRRRSRAGGFRRQRCRVPGFDRATMDGYALMADSTEGATSYTRLPLTVIGDSMPAAV